MKDNNRIKQFGGYVIAGLIGFIFFFIYYPRLDNLTGINIQLSKSEIEKTASDLTNGLDVPVDSLKSSVSLRQNSDLIRYTQKNKGLQETDRLIKQDMPAYFWRINYKEKKTEEDTSGSTVVSFGNSNESENNNDQRNTFVIELATNGQVLSIENHFPPDTSANKLVSEAGIDDVRSVLSRFTSGNLDDWQLLDQSTEHRRWGNVDRFKWVSHKVDWTDSLVATIDMAGNQVRNYSLSSGTVVIRSNQRDAENIADIITVIAMFVIALIILANFIKRLRQDKIDFRNAWIVGILTAVFMAFIFTSQFQDNSTIELVILLLFVAPFVGTFAFVLTSVAESIARDHWNEKLFTLDRLLHSRIYSPKVSQSFFMGLVFCGIILGIFTLSLYVFDQPGLIWISNDNRVVENIISPFAGIHNLGNIWMRTVFLFFAIVVFMASFVRQFFSSKGLLLLITALLFAIVPFKVLSVKPFYFVMFTNFLIGILLIWALLRFNFVTSLAALLSVHSFILAFPFLNQGILQQFSQGLITLLFPVVFVVLSVISLKKVDVDETTKEYVPAYLKRWRERERFQRELEIARRVQLDFLPKSHPDIDWLDVASVCIPAYEVGGDYFDFLKLDNRRFGVIVGDVSGKGVSAAFYMTLMKGIMKSQSRHIQSPREILIQINDLFYENAHRGVFISMIYGVFDFADQTFTFARAGHNPLITHHRQKNSSEQLSPNGIAIGLDKGEIFINSLEEVTVQIHSGDVFVFYTDGFSEAMDEHNNEFGEERLMDIINGNVEKSASTILDQIQTSVSQFTGDTQQHDDMTMVVVRINNLT